MPTGEYGLSFQGDEKCLEMEKGGWLHNFVNTLKPPHHTL